MNPPGITPPLIALTNSKPSPPSIGSISMWQSANWPRPPVCFLWRACAFAFHLSVLGAEHVARVRVLELGHGADVAGAEAIGLLGVLALRDQQRADALLLVRAAVDKLVVSGHHDLEHAEVVDAARERVGQRLE